MQFEATMRELNYLCLKLRKSTVRETKLASKFEIRKSETFVEYQNFQR